MQTKYVSVRYSSQVTIEKIYMEITYLALIKPGIYTLNYMIHYHFPTILSNFVCNNENITTVGFNIIKYYYIY